ncbi:phosphoserine phosphatase SerB [Gluconobacter cerinus]|uniref:phosphoserine phosphatase SerB n=1 Tax=Gluconobacter cerinus TaxID=38307 RepID=UPI001B8D09A7|nr:phosphoserine phosphatase SerB [Gluconobacter cerinus]MBS1040506.1 phosphoserine phosphatase SerB [Gluconobacter cerinus]MBS1047095.1 phosphoserine phosphatase SerB [Gluconobacter cerinus]
MSLPSVLTLIADRKAGPLKPEAIDVARSLVKGKAPIVLSEGEAVDIPCPTPGPGAASAATIRATLAPYQVDTLLLKTRGRRKAVLVADMDSTIVTGETLDEMAAALGVGEQVAAITRASMNGEIDFETSIEQRVALLAGKSASVLEDVWKNVTLTDGAKELVQTMRKHNARTALVSGGFTWFTQRVAELCGFDENHGNILEIVDGKMTGKLDGPVLGPDAKLTHLEALTTERGVQLRAALTTGDGANDIPMLASAGLGLAFHAKPNVKKVIGTQINFSGLRAHLFAQGYRAADFVTD